MTEQMAAIEQTLDEVKEATTRVGRKDWVMLANGALIGLVASDLVPPDVVQVIFHMINEIGHLLRMPVRMEEAIRTIPEACKYYP